MFFFALSGMGQNYFKEYPISISIAFNGPLQRLECSTYDSTLQTTVSFFTPWYAGNYFISGNAFGKIGFTTWINPGVQDSIYGFIIYDYNLHQFDVQTKYINTGSGNQSVNVSCGINWITVTFEVMNGSFPSTTYYFYRYNMHLHKWVKVTYWDHEEENSVVWNNNALGNGDVILFIDHLDELDYFYYDPVSDYMNYVSSGCAGWGFNAADDYIAMDTGCSDNYYFMVHDAELHGFTLHPRRYLLGDQQRGIFYARDQNNSAKVFFFTYDQANHQWITDSIESPNVTNVIMKDRVFTYLDETPGFGQKVFYLVHDPIQHILVKDSTPVAIAASNLSIQNGTVSWIDANGTNIRGYDVNLGWGNYSTPLFLYFHLTDFSLQGQPMIHVRNYSIGSEKVNFDFGDGIVSLNNRHVLWHSYKDSGNYNVCIYDSSGTQSWCQQVNMNFCSTAGVISLSQDTICEGDNVLLSIGSYSGNIQWQSNTGQGWVNETGLGFDTPNYTVSPDKSIKYRAEVTNGSCVPVMSNEKQIKVYENFSGTSVADTNITICQGQSMWLLFINPSATATYLWQENNGSGWNNAAGQNIYPNYNASPTNNTSYRAIMTSGGCFVDTSITINITVNATPSTPVTTPGYSCGPGIVNLSATSSGNINWYLPTVLDSVINVGNTYSPLLNTTSSFTLKATTGASENAGYVNNSIGAVNPDNTMNKGMRFHISETANLECVFVYPAQTGTLTFELYNANTGVYLGQKSQSVMAGTGKTKMLLNWFLQGNITYDVRVRYGNVSLDVNINGISYPVNVGGGSAIILGYVDSVFHNTSDYYNLYDWRFLSGCQSAAASVQGIIETPISNTAIVPTGSTTFCQGGSVTLNSTPTGNYSYQWYKNNIIIPGAVNNSYTAYTPGSYTVNLNSNSCSFITLPVVVSVPCIIRNNNELKTLAVADEEIPVQFKVIYESESQTLTIHTNLILSSAFTFSILDKSGRTVMTQNRQLNPGKYSWIVNVSQLASGIYVTKIESENLLFSKRFVKF